LDVSASAVQETVSSAPASATAQDAIAAASADELSAMIAQYQAEGSNEMVYVAALRLVELDPSDTDAYTAAVDALYAMTGANSTRSTSCRRSAVKVRRTCRR
jgi:DNA-binding SARP family transcriptional activator